MYCDASNSVDGYQLFDGTSCFHLHGGSSLFMGAVASSGTLVNIKIKGTIVYKENS
jgi:hypothetical protein